MYVYLAGALTIHHRNNEFHKATNWRNKFKSWASNNSVNTFDPCINFLREINHTYDPKIVVDQNNYYINKSDICIVCLDSIDFSPGTIFELTRFKELGKPVIAFGSNKHWSPHINSCISNYCVELDGAIDVLENMFDQWSFGLYK